MSSFLGTSASASSAARTALNDTTTPAREIVSSVAARKREPESVPEWVASPLNALAFDNRALRRLRVEALREPNPPRAVPNAHFALVEPTPLLRPRLVAFSPDVATRLLGVPADYLARALAPETPAEDASQTTAAPDQELPRLVAAGILSGTLPWRGGRTAAHVYAGHQFGVFAGQLGDGAAMYVGEVINERGERWEVQYKGAGRTPCSRTADGRKVLRSSIREFLGSEYMFALGIPTTRAGTLVDSDTVVARDQFYDGNPRYERCAVITRVAPTFLRFGSFEIAKDYDRTSGAAGPSRDNPERVRQLVDACVHDYFPDVVVETDAKATHVAWLLDVAKRTARLVASWQLAGWTHGVLNTDNMSIVGATIDYGPYGFIEHFDPMHVPNTSDDQGRYAYVKQPAVCLWNVLKLREALVAARAVEDAPDPSALADAYEAEFSRAYAEGAARKLGLRPDWASLPGVSREDADTLASDLLKTMHETAADFTLTFDALSACAHESTTPDQDWIEIGVALGSLPALRRVLSPNFDPRSIEVMRRLLANPASIPEGISEEMLRNEIARADAFPAVAAIKTESEKAARDERLWRPWLARYRAVVRVAGVPDRAREMRRVNPRFTLRNHVMQRAIERAEDGDYREVRKLVDLALNPFWVDRDDPLLGKAGEARFVSREDGFRYDRPDFEASVKCAVSCSS